MRHRCERGRHEGVAQVDGGAPGEALLALEERGDEGQHGSDPWVRPGRAYELSCSAQIGFSGRFGKRNFDGAAMQMPQAIR